MGSQLWKAAVRQEAGRVMPKIAKAGIVSSYNPDSYTARVLLQPEGLDTGWIPIASQWIGNGWGLMVPPTPGDQVEVVFSDGNLGNGVIVGRLFSDKQLPPKVDSGELWLVHQTGSAFKLTNDGKVLLHGNDEVAVDSTVGVHLGDTGGALRKLIDERLKQVFDAHTHTGVQTGSGTSGPPTTPLDLAAVATTITKAN
jgi:phage baseplate assembly protein V